MSLRYNPPPKKKKIYIYIYKHKLVNKKSWLFLLRRVLLWRIDLKMVKLWCLSCLCCIMMFRWINKQPGMQEFRNRCSHYQEIYDWISNKKSGLPFILTPQSMREMSMVNLVSLVYFTLLKHWMMLLKYNFFSSQGLIFTPHQDTDSM